MRWWVLCFLAGLILLVSVGGFVWLRPAPRASLAPPVPRERCAHADDPVPPLPAEPVDLPVVISSEPKVRVWIDEKPTTAGVGFPPGEHLLRAEADGAEPLELHFPLASGQPAFFDLRVDASSGLTFATLRAQGPEPERVSLDFTRVSDADPVLLGQAAKALRSGDWRRASSRLRGVSPKSRTHALFLRLSASIYQLAGQPQLAEASLAQVPADEAAGLAAALLAFGTVKQVGMRRWNLLTEKFSALAEKFAPDAPGPVQVATGRFAELSAGFLNATQQKDSLAQDETVRAAEEALGQFVRALRRSRPEDCDFQARISASL